MIGALLIAPVAYIIVELSTDASDDQGDLTHSPLNEAMTFLHDGAFLNYSMTYSLGDPIANGWSNITITHANATDLQYTGWQFGSGMRPEELNVIIAPMMRDGVYLGDLALTQIIDIPLGKKCVGTYLRWEDHMHLSSVGQEFGIIYRRTICDLTNALNVN
jgi:hypothetical protein